MNSVKQFLVELLLAYPTICFRASHSLRLALQPMVYGILLSEAGAPTCVSSPFLSLGGHGAHGQYAAAACKVRRFD